MIEQGIRSGDGVEKESLGLCCTHAFVPNDTILSSLDEQLCLDYGPNMAGKSTHPTRLL